MHIVTACHSVRASSCNALLGLSVNCMMHTAYCRRIRAHSPMDSSPISSFLSRSVLSTGPSAPPDPAQLSPPLPFLPPPLALEDEPEAEPEAAEAEREAGVEAGADCEGAVFCAVEVRSCSSFRSALPGAAARPALTHARAAPCTSSASQARLDEQPGPGRKTPHASVCNICSSTSQAQACTEEGACRNKLLEEVGSWPRAPHSPARPAA